MASADQARALFLAHLDAIDSAIGIVCRQHHLDGDATEEFGSHVKLKLLDDDHAILRKFQGRSSIRTYLVVVIQRLFLDYRNASWGKWRPSAEARRAGAIALAFEQLTLRDGYTFDEAHELMRINHNIAITRSELERLTARLPLRVRRRTESETALESLPSPNGAADQLVENERRRTFAARVTQTLQAVLDQVPSQDRLILKMRFEDGRTITEIAAVLGLEHKPLYRRVERLLTSLGLELAANGLEPAEVLDASVTGEVVVDWGGQTYQSGGLGRSSISRGARE